MFKKRKQNEDDLTEEVIELEDGFVDDLSEQERAEEDAELLRELGQDEAERPPLARPTGPWDLADFEEDGLQRLDLGALRVPVPEDIEVRVELNDAGDVVAATLVQGESSLQVNVFAAPRSEGIWSEVIDEIRDSVVEGGGQASYDEGPWGRELRADVPAQSDQGIVTVPARFVAVDGPRWFLRALVTGPAARDRVAAAPLEAAMTGIVVVRGGDPMTVREALPMALPAEAEQARQAAEHGESHDLSLAERGPEITEVR